MSEDLLNTPTIFAQSCKYGYESEYAFDLNKRVKINILGFILFIEYYWWKSVNGISCKYFIDSVLWFLREMNIFQIYNQ